MSISSTHVLTGRVAAAAESSPLALFGTPHGIDCVFANTVEARRRIASGKYSYIATVDRHSDPAVVREILRTFGS